MTRASFRSVNGDRRFESHLFYLFHSAVGRPRLGGRPRLAIHSTFKCPWAKARTLKAPKGCVIGVVQNIKGRWETLTAPLFVLGQADVKIRTSWIWIIMKHFKVRYFYWFLLFIFCFFIYVLPPRRRLAFPHKPFWEVMELLRRAFLGKS